MRIIGMPADKQGDGEEVLHLSRPQGVDRRIVRRPSTPQFQLRLSSRRRGSSSPFASLCLRS
jgi:hypothetical protein